MSKISTAVLFAAEVTGHFDALVPLLVTCAVADYVAIRSVAYNLMTGKLIRRGRTVEQNFTAPQLDGVAASHQQA